MTIKKQTLIQGVKEVQAFNELKEVIQSKTPVGVRVTATSVVYHAIALALQYHKGTLK